MPPMGGPGGSPIAARIGVPALPPQSPTSPVEGGESHRVEVSRTMQDLACGPRVTNLLPVR